jgi:hypothetical protein
VSVITSFDYNICNEESYLNFIIHFQLTRSVSGSLRRPSRLTTRNIVHFVACLPVPARRARRFNRPVGGQEFNIQTRDFYSLSDQWELHTIPAPPRLVWSGVCSMSRRSELVDIYDSLRPGICVYESSSTCAAECRCRYRRERAASVGCGRYCLCALLSRETPLPSRL